MPIQEEWLVFSGWGETYGDIMSLQVLGRIIVIINSRTHADELLEKRSATSADRPVFMMAGELIGWKRMLSLVPYGDRFRQIRKLLYQYLGTKPKVDAFNETIDLETHRLLRRLLDEPDRFWPALQKTTGSIILKITYGYQAKEGADPFVDQVDRSMEEFSRAVQPGAWLVDALPILRYIPAWMPGAGFRRTASLWRQTLDDVATLPFNWVKEHLATGNAVPSFTSTFLDENAAPHEEEVVQWAGVSLYFAGSDTTASSLHWFILAMVLHPDGQRAAQEEIDHVIGSSRLPSLDDRDRLPYIDALVREVFRWRPIGPLALPHRLTQEEAYDGFVLPEGTIILPNVWQMCRDEKEYGPDPEAFNPERFLSTAEDVGSSNIGDPKDLAFGFGRRACPGKIMADVTAWLACARILAVFDISPYKDPVTGEDFLPDAKAAVGLVLQPKPFKCTIKPRSSRAEELIRSVSLHGEA